MGKLELRIEIDADLAAQAKASGVSLEAAAMQSHHLNLDTVVVAPLVNDKLPSNLEIEIEVRGRTLVLALTELS